MARQLSWVRAFGLCLCCLVSAALLNPGAGFAEETTQTSAAEEHDTVRLYRTRRERREAGLHRELGPWLTFSGLAELETARDRFSRVDAADLDERENAANVQLGLVAEPLAWLRAEMILEYDLDLVEGSDEVFLEELTVAIERGSWEFLAGRQYLPFGQYFSSFVTGPILEIGETRETAVTLGWEVNDRVELAASVYEGVATRADGTSQRLDWALAVEGALSPRVGLGASYLSDLGDAGGRLLADQGNRYTRKVPGVSAYLTWIGERFEASFEAVGAYRSFAELPSDRDRPLAWNLELSALVAPAVDVAFRVEGSRELEAFPEIQYGIASTFLIHNNATLTLELLRGRFDAGLAADDDDNPLDDVTRIGAQLSLAF